MFVAGAMYARWAASVMNVPALAARAPEGATHTMTGSGASRNACLISFIAVDAATGGVEPDDHRGGAVAAAVAMPSR